MAPLRQNIGYTTKMSFPSKEAAMIIAQEQALLKAQSQLQDLLSFTQEAARTQQRIDQVERELMRRLLAMGLTLLQLFVAEHGDGDVGPTAPADDGHTLHRLPQPHDRRYVSIFGELEISRVVYGTREGQKIERAPSTSDWPCPPAISLTSWRIGPSVSASRGPSPRRPSRSRPCWGCGSARGRSST